MLTGIKQKVLRLRRKAKWHFQRMRSGVGLRPLNERTIPEAPSEIRLFTMARNEALRLPFFLSYYFERGVDRIFLIDNNSTDDTVNIALAHDNVHVFQTGESFKYYYFWMENLLRRYGNNHWCLGVDLDEFFIYPRSEEISIRLLTEYLERKQFSAVYGLMLDMYAGTDLMNVGYESGKHPILYADYFDAEYDSEYRELYNEKIGRKFRSLRFSGGMRKRLFGIDPNLTKVSLFRYTPKVYTAAGMHAIDGAEVADIRGAVQHFKYLQDFVDRTIEESKRGQHAGGAALYKPMAERLVEKEVTKLHHPGSVKFEDSYQLVDMGILKTSPDYENFCNRMIT